VTKKSDIYLMRIAIGIALGAGIGELMFKNVAIGMILGAVIGIGIGVILKKTKGTNIREDFKE